MTAAHSFPTRQSRPLTSPEESGTKHGPALVVAGTAVGVLGYLAACAVAFALDWRIAIPVVLVAGIAVVVAAERLLSRGLVVDETPDALERMLLNSTVTLADDARGDQVPPAR